MGLAVDCLRAVYTPTNRESKGKYWKGKLLFNRYSRGEYYGAQPYWRNIQAWHISEHSVNDLVNITSLGSVQLMGNIIYTVIVCIGNINTFKLSFFLLKPTFIQHFESCWWLSECEVRPAVWTIEMEMRDDADMNIEKTNQKLFVLFRI